MSAFFAALRLDPAVRKLSEELAAQPQQILAHGCAGSLKHAAVAAAYDGTPRPLAIVTAGRESLRAWQEDLTALLPEADVYELPELDYALAAVQGAAKGMERSAQRMNILGRLLRREPIIVLADIGAAAQKGLSAAEFSRASLSLRLGDTLVREELLARMVGMGYEHAAEVEHVGQFSVRGGIVDIFPINALSPIRIEFFDAEIDSMREYDAVTRRSIKNISTASIMPLRAADDEGEACFLSYLGAAGITVFDEPTRLITALHDAVQEDAARAARIFSWEELVAEGAAGHELFVSLMSRKLPACAPRALIPFQMVPMTAFRRQFTLLESELRRYLAQQVRVLVLAGGSERANVIRDMLAGWKLPAALLRREATPAPGEISAAGGALRAGFELPAANVVILTEQDIFGRHKAKLRRSAGAGERIRHFREIAPGDYVVHVSHGIGKYLGVETLEVAGVHRDYLHIQYGGDDKLFVPTDQVGLLQKYIGAEGAAPRLHRMGTADWARARAKAQKSVEDIADHLLEIYAKRKLAAGHAFTPDDAMQREFEEAFPYEETEDQLRAIEEIKRDMESERPMDRLLCGDVGFGKTEVAVRAAFKAAMDGFQVAVLVPTTVLAQQHYQTFAARFADFAPKVDVVCRFRTPREQAETLREVEEGRVDILIGTHAILNRTRVHFRKLGLLIVDEEQRFGVTQKERIKEFAAGVDVLTLSATPIPRTLHMSLAGARDMSIIETPPADRLPVQSYVVESSDAMMRGAIERELSRKGQVYFIYNRVESIDRMREHLLRLVPEARIATAHGQMNEDILEQVMMDFYEGHYDILLATSIIENGIDVANANTVIIYDADRFGLSQLYQMRGRVGRSAKMAFAYFTYRRDKVLSETAEKRLQAMKEFAQLGSGFKIAMRDLEIRGAGSLLGAQQHGHIAGVGCEMYVKLLEEAVAKRRGVAKESPEVEPVIDLPVEAYIDGGYIEDAMHKIEIYQKIAAVRTGEDLDALLDELIDRFGEPTPPVLALLDIARIKNLARSFGARSITAHGEAFDISLPEGTKLPLQALVRLNECWGRQIGPVPEGAGYRIRLNAKECKYILDTALEIVQMICGE
ncbi:transcription-repair coupling factor [Selenomonas artemidis]|uniref:transcription-repair coupling factor n=1 Tax=Selenomonas artemidis TaxID=671224 RepID=UPI00288A014A|nr:transcription-repair coupling factor [Selenomonas artemidis]